jgi:hypothetical protein
VSLSFLRADLAARTTSLHVLGGCVGVIIAIYGLFSEHPSLAAPA